MSRPDAAASAALDAEVIRPKFFAFMDFANEPVRVNTSGADKTFTGTGVADLDGFTFSGIDGDLVDISPVVSREGGSEQITATLSGLIDLDNDMLNEIGDRSNWQGRTVRFWRTIHNADDVQQGGIQHYYTGYMVDLSIKSRPREQVIEMIVESYLAAFSEPSNRDYDQQRYDPGDLSYRAGIAIANGTSGNPITNNTPNFGRSTGVGGGGAGGGGGLTSRQVSFF
ncbi:hypothetical protein [Erythrobacter rubeus]|uniref:DUF2163 domain-containing protein n=1 Tax=Erythrobacter rubeus TaxID=2760803 RepID=A0ABR8KWW7_9SPHN|nr:hypothetical protein [Erythrobacter rubeus]MBD2842712.1 hypothetical protein [Erythrobacter rubeus]